MTAFDQFKTHGFVVPLIAMCDAQFPRTCTTCGRSFLDFGQFVDDTLPIGSPVCFDEDEESLVDPIGTLSMVNCRCGTTLALECANHGEMYDQFVAALRFDAKTQALTVGEVLSLMRLEIRGRVSRRS